jgi:hypothetical protein
VAKFAITAIAVALSLTAVGYAENLGSHPALLLTVALTTQSGELRAGQLIGSAVHDVQNRNIGSVKDILLDRDGKVAAVVVDVGAFLGVGGKYVAVSLGDLKTDNDRLTLDRSKEQLQSARSYQLDNMK